MELDLKKITELMRAMREADCSRLRLKLGENEIELERKQHVEAVSAHPMPHVVPPVAAAVAAPLPSAPAPAPAADAAPSASSGNFVTAPMVGTFYGSPSPEAESFVKVGDTVTEGTVICIIEAMKVMNEVKAGMNGVVKEMLVDNGHPVEFGTKLFRVE